MAWSICSRRPLLGIAIAALAVVGASACGGSSKPGAAAPGSPAAKADGSGALGSAVGDISSSTAKWCGALKTADVQALVKATIGKPTVNPFECDYLGGQLTVSIYPNDNNKKYYSDQAGTGGTPISGIGDEAVFIQPVVGETTPSVIAHKGTLTCNASAPSDMSTTTMAYTGSGPIYQATAADEAAYAAKLAVLCKDVFSVS